MSKRGAELEDAPGANGFDCLVDRGAYERVVRDRDRYEFTLKRIADAATAERMDAYAWANEMHELARETLGLTP